MVANGKSGSAQSIWQRGRDSGDTPKTDQGVGRDPPERCTQSVCVPRGPGFVCLSKGQSVVSAERTKDPTPFDPAEQRASQDVPVVAALKRIAEGIEVLTAEVRRAGQTGSSVTIDVNRTYSRAEVADLLNVTTRTVDRRVRDGAILAIKNGNTVRIDGASLHRHRSREQLVAGRRVLKL